MEGVIDNVNFYMYSNCLVQGIYHANVQLYNEER